jgi:alkyldihydroxyacetonephosphate synthase
MRRWNGWGDEDRDYELPPSALAFLRDKLGQGSQRPDASLEEVLSTMPSSRLWDNPWITTDPETRLRHARGQSLPDWVALRSGNIGVFPDGVAFPSSDQEVRTLFEIADESEVRLIPYGGGTSVVGHINPLPGERPVLTVNLSRMDQVTELDEVARLATLGAGLTGPQVEAGLNQRGYTLGHFPQSFELSTVGGWIATRSSGQQSYYYGRIEDLFAGAYLETPVGSMYLPPHPASAAGPDLRELILGSEGRYGIITRAILRVRPMAVVEEFYGVFFRDWESGIEALRSAAQEGLRLSMLRLSDPTETETTLLLSGKEKTVQLAQRALDFIGYGPQRCLLVFGVTGDRQATATVKGQANALFRAHNGSPSIGLIGDLWKKSRFRSPYLRNSLWEEGYAVDTLETAAPWSSISSLAEEVIMAMREAITGTGARMHVFSHLSHVYADGASAYITMIIPRADVAEETLRRWRRAKETASRVILERGGTISHQHGVGVDHEPYFVEEKGAIGVALLEAARREIDPKDVMNPGKLIGEI